MQPSFVRCASALAVVLLATSCTAKKDSASPADTKVESSAATAPVTDAGGQVPTVTPGAGGEFPTTTSLTDRVIRVSGRYVGRVDQDPSISAALVSDGFTILAYFTNGEALSTWFRGPLLAGGAIVRKSDGDTLRAIVEPQVVHGTVMLPDGREVTFSGTPAGDDRGLFRKAEYSNGVSKIQGWIVQNDGSTVSRTELSYASSLVPLRTLSAPAVKQAAPADPTTSISPAGASPVPTSARPGTKIKAIAVTGQPDAPVLTDSDPIDQAAKVDSTTEDVAPPTPNSPLRFVISATGDSLASGEGAPDVGGKYEGPDLATCRTSSNSVAAYTAAELRALGALPGLGSRLFIEAGAAIAQVADARTAADSYAAAKRDADTARQALDTATATSSRTRTAATAAALATAKTNARTADSALSAATAVLLAKVGPVTARVDTVLPIALRNAAGYTATGAAGPFANLAPLSGPQRSALRFASFWTSYQPCATQPLKRTAQEQWQSAFTQSKPEATAKASTTDDDATRCHRSMNAPTALAAAQLKADLPDVNVIYRSFACAGSSSTAIDETTFAGIQPPKGTTAAPLAPQADQLAAWARDNDLTTVDSFYLGLGAATSTFGVSPAVCALPVADVAGKDCKATEAAALKAATTDLTKRVAAVQSKLGSFSPATTTGPTTAQAMLTQFQSGPAPVRLAAIHVPSIPAIASDSESKPCPTVEPLSDQDRSLSDHLTTEESAQLSSDVVPALNTAVAAAVKEAKWDLISGIQEDFMPHGFCATDAWVHTNRSANEQQAALIGKTPSSAGAPDHVKTLLPDALPTRTAPAPDSDTDADTYQVAQAARNDVPVGGLQANTAMLLPNTKGYQQGYLPPLLKAVRVDASIALTPAEPDQFRADPAPDGVTLRWRDRSVNERTYVVSAAKDTAEPCGASSLAPLDADSQSVTLTVKAGTSCAYSVQACGATLAGTMLCSEPANATFTASPPAAPKNVTAVPGDRFAVVRWDPVANATHYVVHLQLSNGASLAAVTDLAFVTLPEGGDPLPGGQHTVLVRSCATSCGSDGPAVPLNMNGPAAPSTSTTSTTMPAGTTTVLSAKPTTSLTATTRAPSTAPTATTTLRVTATPSPVATTRAPVVATPTTATTLPTPSPTTATSTAATTRPTTAVPSSTSTSTTTSTTTTTRPPSTTALPTTSVARTTTTLKP